ncbi:hypothetical protein V6Z11_D10G202900 [Gossypium hirsutum]
MRNLPNPRYHRCKFDKKLTLPTLKDCQVSNATLRLTGTL